MNCLTFIRKPFVALSLAAFGFSTFTLHAAPPAMPEITFTATGGVVSSINVNSPLYFGLTSAFNNSALQLRILDLFPSTTSTGANLSGNNNYLVQNGSGNYATGYTAMSSHDVDGDSAGDALFFLYGSSTYNFTNGSTVVVSGSGNANVGSSLQMPFSGTYSAYLTSGADGSQLSSPITIKINGTAIPEPSAYAAIAGGVVLVGVAAKRRRRQA